MEILLLVAIIAIGASGLFVAATFNKRTKQNAAPLVDSVATAISRQIEELRQQLHAIATELQQEKELADLDRGRTYERLDHADRQISSIADKISTGFNAIKREHAQIGTWQDQFSGNLQLQLGHQAAQHSDSLSRLSESLDQLSTQVAGIEGCIRSQERRLPPASKE